MIPAVAEIRMNFVLALRAKSYRGLLIVTGSGSDRPYDFQIGICFSSAIQSTPHLTRSQLDPSYVPITSWNDCGRTVCRLGKHPERPGSHACPSKSPANVRLSCPGCYAYGDSHLGGEKKLTELSDLRGDALVEGVMGLVKKHRPLPCFAGGRGAHDPAPRTQPHSAGTQPAEYFHHGGDQRDHSHPDGVDGTAAEPGGGFHRRTARASRSAPQARDLRSHSGKHPRTAK